jgi:hypothetical protein
MKLCHQRFVGTSLLGLVCSLAWLSAQETPTPATAPEWVGKPAVIVATTGRAPWVGFEVARADDVVRAQLPKLPKGVGFVISNVIANGPARQAGVVPFDVLWKWNDQLLINEAQLAVLLETHKIGDSVELTLFRAGEEKKLKVTLGAEPNARSVAAGPTIESAKTPTMVPQLETTRPLDINTRIARLEDGSAVLEMESRAEGTWLTITDQDGNSVFEGFFDSKSEKKIPIVWHERINALHSTLQDRITKKPIEVDLENRPDIKPVTPVSNPR